MLMVAAAYKSGFEIAIYQLSGYAMGLAKTQAV